MAQESNQAHPSASDRYLSGEDYVNGVTAGQRRVMDYEAEASLSMGRMASGSHYRFDSRYDFDGNDFHCVDYNDGVYEEDFYDDPHCDEPLSNFSCDDSAFDDHDEGEEDDKKIEEVLSEVEKTLDTYTPVYGSPEQLSSGRSRASRYFVRNGVELPSKLAIAERLKKTRKPDKVDEGCWKRHKRKQWQNENYRWVGPESIKQLPVIDRSSSVLVDILDFPDV